MTCLRPHCECKGDPTWIIGKPGEEVCLFQHLRKQPHPHTLQEIANLLGMSLFTVTTIEKNAVRDLRKALYRLEIDEEDFTVK